MKRWEASLGALLDFLFGPTITLEEPNPMLNIPQFRSLVIKPALITIGRYSEDAEELLLGTALVESNLSWLAQNRGPALGVFQMEPRTHKDIWRNYLAHRHTLRELVHCLTTMDSLNGTLPFHEELAFNLRYSAALARIHYLRIPEPLPSRLSVWDMASYWKRHYNTELGAGRPEDFVNRYNIYAGRATG